MWCPGRFSQNLWRQRAGCLQRVQRLDLVWVNSKMICPVRASNCKQSCGTCVIQGQSHDRQAWRQVVHDRSLIIYLHQLLAWVIERMHNQTLFYHRIFWSPITSAVNVSSRWALSWLSAVNAELLWSTSSSRVCRLFVSSVCTVSKFVVRAVTESELLCVVVGFVLVVCKSASPVVTRDVRAIRFALV